MTINVVLMQRLQPRFAVLAEVRFIHVSYTWWIFQGQTHYELLNLKAHEVTNPGLICNNSSKLIEVEKI